MLKIFTRKTDKAEAAARAWRYAWLAACAKGLSVIEADRIACAAEARFLAL